MDIERYIEAEIAEARKNPQEPTALIERLRMYVTWLHPAHREIRQAIIDTIAYLESEQEKKVRLLALQAMEADLKKGSPITRLIDALNRTIKVKS